MSPADDLVAWAEREEYLGDVGHKRAHPHEGCLQSVQSEPALVTATSG